MKIAIGANIKKASDKIYKDKFWKILLTPPVLKLFQF
jgi:hypothetical protein